MKYIALIINIISIMQGWLGYMVGLWSAIIDGSEHYFLFQPGFHNRFNKGYDVFCQTVKLAKLGKENNQYLSYVTTHSTHFYQWLYWHIMRKKKPVPYWRKERNVLFNDALNTFYLWLYGVRHMVKDNSDSERGNPLLPHRLLFAISSKGSFICIIPQTG